MAIQRGHLLLARVMGLGHFECSSFTAFVCLEEIETGFQVIRKPGIFTTKYMTNRTLESQLRIDGPNER